MLSIFLDCGHLIGTVDILANLYGLSHQGCMFSPSEFHRISNLSPALEGVIYATILSDHNLDVSSEIITNNQYTFPSRRNIKLCPEYIAWEQFGWIGASYVYDNFLFIIECIFKEKLPNFQKVHLGNLSHDKTIRAVSTWG